MSETAKADETLRTIASVLGWCLVFTIVGMLMWLVMLLCADDFVYRTHQRFFDISKNQLVATHYAAMVFFKMAACIFFFFPYLGIRIVLLKRKG